MAQVSGIEVKFTGDTSGLEKSVKRAEGVVSSFAKGTLAGLAGALSVGMFVQAGRAALNFADDIGKMAQKVGMSTEALSKLTYAAKLSDVSMQELQVGVQMLSKNMEAGSEGLAALGISATDSAGNLRSTADVFADVAEAFANMEDGAGKTAIAMNIFGRSGAQLIPLLNSGRDGLKDMGDEAKRFGVVVSSNAAQGAERFNDNLTRLQTISDGLTQNLVQSLLPALNDVLQALLDYVANGDKITGVVSGIKTEFEDLGRVVSVVSNKTTEISGFFATIDEFVRKYGPMSGAAKNGFFGMFPDNALQDPTGSLASIDNFNPQSVNRDGKGDLQKPPAPGLGGNNPGKGDGMREPGIPNADAVDAFFIDRLAAIQDGFKTEREVLAEEYAANQEVLRGALDNQLITEEQYRRLNEQLEQDHQKNLASIRQQAIDVQLSAAADLFGSLARLMDGGNKKMMKMSKVFAAAQVVINTAQGISKAFAEFGWPAGIIPAAAIAASGAAQLASIANAESGKIKGASAGGGSRGGGRDTAGATGGGGGGGPTTTFQFTLMNDPMGFGEKFARQFIDQLNSTQRNGGQIRGVIA